MENNLVINVISTTNGGVKEITPGTRKAFFSRIENEYTAKVLESILEKLGVLPADCLPRIEIETTETDVVGIYFGFVNRKGVCISGTFDCKDVIDSLASLRLDEEMEQNILTTRSNLCGGMCTSGSLSFGVENVRFDTDQFDKALASFEALLLKVRDELSYGETDNLLEIFQRQCERYGWDIISGYNRSLYIER